MKKHKPTRIEIDYGMNQAIDEAVTKLVPIFTMFGWTWHDTDGRVPTAERMRESVVHLVETVNEQDIDFCSSGRISAHRYFDGEASYIEISLDLSTVYDERMGQ